jgi:ADP-heptose:LPS heptosyltransferase
MSIKLLNTEKPFAQPLLQADLQHVLVVQSETPSDLVMLSPALRALRQSLPDASITLLTSTAGSEVAPLVPWVDDVMVDQDIRRDSYGAHLFNPGQDVAFIEKLRGQNFSLALIFTSFSKSALPAAHACYLAGIPYRIGFASEMSGSLLSHVLLPPTHDVHQVDRNLSLLAAIGVSGEDRRTELSIPEQVENSGNQLLSAVGLKPNLPYIVVAPGTNGGQASQYGLQRFAAVVHILEAQIEEQLVIVGNAAEAKTIQPVLDLVNENLYGNVFSLVEKATLPELAAIIGRASLTIANNSVSMHFAEAFECPMVILHSETEMVSQWMPRNASVRFLSRPASCSPCDHAECPYGINCLDVRPEEVAIAALEVLSEQTYNQPSYRGILEYKIETEAQAESSIH